MRITIDTPETNISPFERLLAAIERGDLAPGARMREAELAEKLNISRTPVREALHRLQTMGLVVPGPQRGLVIAHMSYEQLRQLFAVREGLEGMAARLAAFHASPEEIEVMREMVKHDAEVRDASLLRDRNKILHRQIYRASHNTYLNEILENLRIHLSLLRGSTYYSDARIDSAQAEHHEIVEAIAARDADAAEKAARNHIVNGYRMRISLMSGEFDQN